jgi:surfactin synthase thioesterase subunit
VRVFGGEHFFIESHRAAVLAHLSDIVAKPSALTVGGVVGQVGAASA